MCAKRGCDEMAHWWLVFDDPVLQSLVESAYLQNITLRQAGFRVLEARALRNISAGNLFPQTQEYTLQGRRHQLSRNVDGLRGAEKNFGIWDEGFNLNWELDIWGRFRRAVEAADADLDASVENYDDVLVTLLADTASAYVNYRTALRRIELARANVERQREVLQIAEVRYSNGQTSELDVDQARANLAQTESTIPALEIVARIANNQLCVLLGVPVHDLGPQLGYGSIPTAPSEVILGIPADLLRRRPDVRRAERNLAAQCARIGVAEADLYPRISITGTIGLNASEFKDLHSADSLRGAIGPSVRWDILNYGRLLNNIRVQDARFQQLAAAFQQSVLRANAEIENGLVTFLRTQTQQALLAQSVEATQRANTLVIVQYREGLVDFTRVFQVQQGLAVQQDAEAAASGRVALALIDLNRALGGGWQLRLDCVKPTIVPPAPPPEELPAPSDGQTPPNAAPNKDAEMLKLKEHAPAASQVRFRDSGSRP
jgi:NodT family efflux transporter outer membrane factor (OMF) lipoprotein